MYYTSTRSTNSKVRSGTAILNGIADDGGLYVPTELPLLDINELPTDYRELAARILSLFLTDISESGLYKLLAPYTDLFTEPCKLIALTDRTFLELWHGPTAAFKDMALTVFPALLQHARRVCDVSEEIVILTATSGDTGSAALSGFAGIDGVKIIVFYPDGGVSEIQERQMRRVQGSNTRVVAVKGNFDDCQTGVKQIFADEDFKQALKRQGYLLSSANSINIGRLLPQIVYYFYAYKQLGTSGPVNFVVPTGNFGNILAGLYAKQMGIPIHKLIAASNENRVVADFLKTGRYDRRRELKLTASPSMDILVSSNLERFLALFMQADEVHEAMTSLASEGYYEVDPTRFAHLGVLGGFASEQETEEEIHKLYNQARYLSDPHTAVASRVYDTYKLETGDETPTVIISTASPYKFPETMAKTLGLRPASDIFETIRDLKAFSGQEIPPTIRQLEGAPLNGLFSLGKNALKQQVTEFLSGH